jgi:hypothetical protein
VDAIKNALGLAKTAKVIIPVTADILLFEIVENNPGPAENRSAFFVYVGGGVGVSASLPGIPSKAPSVSVSLRGPFTPFRTNRPVFLPTFAGTALVGQPPQATLGPKSVNAMVQLAMESQNLRTAGAIIIPRNLNISTGPGFGATLFSGTIGRLMMVSNPSKFTGP